MWRSNAQPNTTKNQTKNQNWEGGRKGHNILKPKFSNILAKTYLNLKNEECFKLIHSSWKISSWLWKEFSGKSELCNWLSYIGYIILIIMFMGNCLRGIWCVLIYIDLGYHLISITSQNYDLLYHIQTWNLRLQFFCHFK